MSRPSFSIGIIAAGLVVAMTGAPAPASATTFDNLAYLTFSGSVQIPGHTTLGSGTYRFRLADADSGRSVIQVLSHDGGYVYGMFLTIPEYRSVITDEATVTFMEVPAGVAPPVKSLFYGGESRGYQLVYGKGEPITTAPPVKPQPEITFEANPTPSVAPAYAPATAAAPSAEPLAEPPAAGAPIEATPGTLPATASKVPAAAFGGFASLILGLGIGLLRRYRG